MNDLVQVTKKLGEAYSTVKTWDKAKTEARAEFFKIASQQHEVLANKIANVEASSLTEAIKISEQNNPGWNALSATEVGENAFEVRMEENPDFKPFTFINPDNGMVYQKQIVSGPVMFDDERLESDHPEIYAKVTFMPEPKRELKPLDEIEDELLAVLQDYIYEGKPVIKLAAPRKAKPEELE